MCCVVSGPRLCELTGVASATKAQTGAHPPSIRVYYLKSMTPQGSPLWFMAAAPVSRYKTGWAAAHTHPYRSDRTRDTHRV